MSTQGTKPKSRKRHTITCAVCGKVTAVYHAFQQTCSVSCRGILKTRRAIEEALLGKCAFCGIVKPLPYRVHEHHVCSYKCDRDLRNRLGVDERKHVPQERACLHCGKRFNTKQYNQKCCSTACSLANGSKPSEHRRQRQKELRERHRTTLLREIEACAICGVEIESIKAPIELGMKTGAGKAKIHRDHIIARSSGGGDDIVNTRYVCWFCNTARADLPSSYDPAIAAAGKAFWESVNKGL